jgi:hypothetical protein
VKCELTIWERQFLEMNAGGIRGPAASMRQAFRLIDAVELTDGEKDEIGYRILPQGPHWNGDGPVAEVEIGDPSLAQRLVRDYIESNEKRESWTPDLMRRTEALSQKVGVNFDTVIQELETTDVGE